MQVRVDPPVSDDLQGGCVAAAVIEHMLQPSENNLSAKKSV